MLHTSRHQHHLTARAARHSTAARLAPVRQQCSSLRPLPHLSGRRSCRWSRSPQHRGLTLACKARLEPGSDYDAKKDEGVVEGEAEGVEEYEDEEQQLGTSGAGLDEFVLDRLDPEDEELAARRRTGSQAGPSGMQAPSEGGEGWEGELEGELDILFEDEAAEGEAGEGEAEGVDSKYPEVPFRALPLDELLKRAEEDELAEQFEGLPMMIFGLQDDPDNVINGDMYVCLERVGLDGPFDGHDHVEQAIAAGASAILAEEGRELQGVHGKIAVIYVDNVYEMSARLAAIFYGSPSTDMQLVAVTGTSGKTTVSWLVRGILEEQQLVTGMVGSIEHALAEDLMTSQGYLWQPEQEDPTANRECSAPYALAPYRGKYWVDETTPNGIRLQKMLAGMHDRGATAAVVECSSEALALGYASYMEVKVAVFTNFGEEPSHVELHGSPQDYLEAKLGLFRDLTDPEQQQAVVNLDDPAAPAVLAAAGDVPVVTYALNNPQAYVWPVKVTLGVWQTELIVRTPYADLEIFTNLIGRHNIHNILAAVATGVALGVTSDVIVNGIEAVVAVPGRAEVVNAPLEGEESKLPSHFPVVVDAADTPQRLGTMLTDLREAGAQRIFTVFGCDGEVGDARSRARMGEAAHLNSEVVIVTNTSPRMEEPSAIVEDVVAGWPDAVTEPYAAYAYNPFQDQHNVPLWFEPFLHSAQRHKRRYIMEDRFSAIRAAIGTAKEGDVVLLAGQGHRDYVEYWDGKEGVMKGWFDDRVEARNALSKLDYLYSLVDLKRNELPWGEAPDGERSVVVEFD